MKVLHRTDVSKARVWKRRSVQVVVSLVLGLAALPTALAIPALVPAASADGVALVPGDVLASIGSGQVKNFSPTGTLQDTLDTTSGANETTGMCFDSSKNLYVTDFGAQTMSKFSPAAPFPKSAKESPANSWTLH